MKKKGGARPGAGRPKGSKDVSTIDKEKLAEEIRLMLVPHAEAVVEAMIAKCLIGDASMIKEYWDRTCGKVSLPTEIKGDVKILVKYANSRTDPGE
jgi:hypothetical protein